jgi:hypothetical protein
MVLGVSLGGDYRSQQGLMPVMQTVLDKFAAAGGDPSRSRSSAWSPTTSMPPRDSKYGTVERYFDLARRHATNKVGATSSSSRRLTWPREYAKASLPGSIGVTSGERHPRAGPRRAGEGAPNVMVVVLDDAASHWLLRLRHRHPDLQPPRPAACSTRGSTPLRQPHRARCQRPESPLGRHGHRAQIAMATQLPRCAVAGMLPEVLRDEGYARLRSASGTSPGRGASTKRKPAAAAYASICARATSSSGRHHTTPRGSSRTAVIAARPCGPAPRNSCSSSVSAWSSRWCAT